MPVQTTSGGLPRELVDQVVKCLRDDKPSLAICTLLSRFWYLSAQPILFRTLKLCVKETGSTSPGVEFVDFSRYLASPTQNFPQHVKELHLWGSDPVGRRTTLTISYLSTILSSLPRLTTLRLDSIRWSGPAIPPANSYLPIGLDTLELVRQSGPQVSKLFSLFADVDKVILNHMPWLTGTRDMGADPIPPHFRVRDLTMQYVENTLIELVGQSPCMESVEVLQCRPMSLDGYFGRSETWQKSFDVTTNVITHLDLGIYFSIEVPVEDWFAFNVSRFAQLNCFTIRVFHQFDNPGEHMDRSFEYVHNLVSTLPACIKQITIVLEPTHLLPDLENSHADSVLWGTVEK